MANEQARGFIQQAAQSIQSSQFAQALELVDQAITLDANDSEAHVLRGVALSYTNQPEAAVQSFQRAIALDPTNNKAFYNLAIHYYRNGQKLEALAMAREVVGRDASHAGARELVTRIETETGTPSQPAMPQPGSGEPFYAPQAERPGYNSANDPYAPVHSLGFVEKMGNAWTTLGWVLTGVTLLFFVISAANTFSVIQLMLSGNMEELQRQSAMQSAAGPMQWVMTVVSSLVVLCTLLWMILDIADRRGNWLWVVPLILMCCCFGLHWILLVIYLLAGRK